MKEIVVDLAEPLGCKVAFNPPGELSDEQHAAISAAVEQWAKEYRVRMLSQTLKAFGDRLIELAMPST